MRTPSDSVPPWQKRKTVSSAASSSSHCQNEKEDSGHWNDNWKRAAYLKFINYTDKDVGIYWLQENARSWKEINVVKPGARFRTNRTEDLEYWMVTDENGECLNIYLPHAKELHIVEIR